MTENEGRKLHLFEGYGVELEYMLVDAETLSVLPAADRILEMVSGDRSYEYEDGEIGWGNEFVKHVIELQNSDPSPTLTGLASKLHRSMMRVEELAERLGGRLLSAGMHPWMVPEEETRLWDHVHRKIYRTFDRIFNCRRHGWANLQSCQLNISFWGDPEFGKLHAAIRVLLPIMPALASSSPLMDSVYSGVLNNRLEVYRRNSHPLRSIAGDCIPEPVFSEDEYRREILQRIYTDLGPLDPEGILQHEWANARGTIPRFDRSAFEIRILDMQECPDVDLAICKAIVAVLKDLTSGKFADETVLRSQKTANLHSIFLEVIREGELASIRDASYLECFGINSHSSLQARDLWHHLIESCWPTGTGEDLRHQQMLRRILDEGVLSRRIIAAASGDHSRENLRHIYAELADCLREGRMFGV